MSRSNTSLRYDPDLRKWYGKLFDKYPDHPVFLDEQDTLRWKPNRLMQWLGDREPLPFNDMYVACDRGDFPVADLKRFYRDIGYSLSGYLEIFPKG